MLQDLPRWIRSHPDAQTGTYDSFVHYWARRQEFRSVVRYRVKSLSVLCGTNTEKFDQICSGLGWLFVSNLILSCNEIGPGLYVEHGFSTVVYAKKLE